MKFISLQVVSEHDLSIVTTHFFQFWRSFCEVHISQILEKNCMILKGVFKTYQRSYNPDFIRIVVELSELLQN